MARDQPLDADFRRISTDPNSGLTLRKIPIGDFHLHVDISNGPARPFVPFSWRKRIFKVIHGLGHPGIERTRQMVRDKFVWPSLRADVSRWARNCMHCQRAKVTRNTVPPIHEFTVPDKRFSHIHADITMMPDSDGYKYLLTIIDRFSRWPAAIPLKDITTETVVNAFSHGWIGSFGIPQVITTDRGSQFLSAVWTQLLDVWGIQHNTTTAYHPQANGMVERLHRRLKESLMALCGDDRHSWFWRLPMALLALRTTLKPDIDASPAELVYGEGLAVPGDLLPSLPTNLNSQRQNTLANLRLEVERLQPKQTSAHHIPHVHIPEDLKSATHVMIRRGGVNPPLTQPYEGPFRVESHTQTGVKVHLPGRGIEEIALARVKPAYSENVDQMQDFDDLEDQQPPSPPPPGRRPGPRTRPPEPTQRVTRQQRANPANLTPQPPDPGMGTSTQAEPQPGDLDTDSEDEYRNGLRRAQAHTSEPPNEPPQLPTPLQPQAPPETEPVNDSFGNPPEPAPALPTQAPPEPKTSTAPRLFTKERQRTFSNRGGPVPQGHSGNNKREETRHTFSKPRPNNFSFQRRRPDISALNDAIREHLGC